MSEAPPDEVPSSKLSSAVDISSELSSGDRQRLLDILERNREAFLRLMRESKKSSFKGDVLRQNA